MLQTFTKKLENKKGFTLMEVLIVVAIIAILMAIAIPAFSGALTEAKVRSDQANVRAYYAEVMMKEMTRTTTTSALPAEGEIAAATMGLDKFQAAGAKVVAVGTTAEKFKLTYTATAANSEISFGGE